MEKSVTFQLNRIGMSNKIKGFNYCRKAILYICKNNGFPVADKIYGYVSKNYNTNKLCVERNIRYAIEKTWETGNVFEIDKIFGLTVNEQKGKPTNMEFLCLIADVVKNKTA